MAVLIVCKAITVWTQVIFTMLVSNPVSCTRPEWLRSAHRINTTHTQARKQQKCISSAHTHFGELHSITIRSTQRQRGTARCKGQKSQHLHGKVKGRAGNNPLSPGHECNRRHHSPMIHPMWCPLLVAHVSLCVEEKKHLDTTETN